MSTRPPAYETEARPGFLILGGTGGIGSVVCRRLAARGWRVALGARDERRLEDLAASLEAPFFTLDATRSDDVENCTAFAKEQLGRLDGVVNCVGSILLKPAHLTSDEEWSETLAQNLGTAFNVVRSAARHMRSHGGSVVLLSSAAARVGLPSHEAIAAAKAGIVGLTLAAASSYAAMKLRVNAVAPGLVRTPLSEKILSSPAAEKASRLMHPLGRLGEPEDVAAAIEWLLDPDVSWITGQVLGVDGGLATVRPKGGR